jgi:hypothetical protein
MVLLWKLPSNVTWHSIGANLPVNFTLLYVNRHCWLLRARRLADEVLMSAPNASCGEPCEQELAAMTHLHSFAFRPAVWWMAGGVG